MPNTVAQIMKFFSTKEKPVKTSEFSEFWKACTEEEKEEFKNADLGDLDEE